MADDALSRDTSEATPTATPGGKASTSNDATPFEEDKTSGEDALTPGLETGSEHNGSPETHDEEAAMEFPIVGIGASAGGLAALSSFFDALPPQSGLAVVIVQHLSPDHESQLAQILQNHTFMHVSQIDDTPEVQPGHVYVIPPGRTLTFQDGRLHLGRPLPPRAERAPIDLFFRSLAENLGDRAVAVVFSGTGSDGAQGLTRVKERGGLTLAQAPEEAEYDAMPLAAIRTQLVDFVAPAAELARRLVELRETHALVLPAAPEKLPKTDAEALAGILQTLRLRTGHSFDNYKRSTLQRRIQRRIQVTRVDGMVAYLHHIRDHREEASELLQDLLISVTNFFRDPEAFMALEHEAIAHIARGKKEGDTIRTWVVGCATGEEAYTVAMLLCEHAPEGVNIQVFATDIDENAIASARSGHYPETIETDISPERLRRFFERASGGGYRVRESLRQRVLFATHNLLADPPFSHLDLITCRNLLIYVQRAAQAEAFEQFVYALRSGGYLFLGSSETATPQLFDVIDEKQRLYRRREDLGERGYVSLAARSGAASGGTHPALSSNHSSEAAREIPSIESAYDSWTLKRYAPPRLLINRAHQITHVFGGAGWYLTDGEGRVTQDVFARIARPLRVDLRVVLHEAFRGESTRSPYLRIGDRVVRLHAGPIEAPGVPEGMTEVVFIEADPEASDVLSERPSSGNDGSIIPRLEAELDRTRSQLQEALEEHETGNEELRASNEELQSLNEELQSATEELETSKEELQSMNEELITVNQELHTKVDELNQAYSDLVNLMQSTDIGTLFLDRELRIKRFTPKATELFHLLPSDVGRPLSHIAHTVKDIDLVEVAESVLVSLTSVEHEAESAKGRWYLLRLVPYRTVEDKIEGVVASFLDITARRVAEAEVTQRAQQQAAIADLGRRALQNTLVLDDLFHVACESAREALGTDMTKVLEHRPSQQDLLMRAGCGWASGLVGNASVPDETESQAGYTLLQHTTVVVPDFAGEDRFTAPSLLTDHEVVSGMSVIIEGEDGPWGVLGTHSRSPQAFSTRDAVFLQSVANVLAEALRRDRDETRLRELADKASRHAAEMNAVIEAIPDGIYIGDEEGVRHANSVALRLVGVETLEEMRGATSELGQKFNVRWAGTGSPLAPEEYPFSRALQGETVIENVVTTNLSTGEDIHFRAAAAPILLESEIVGAVGVNTDISSIVRLQARLVRREETIRAQLAELSAVYDSLPIGLAFRDTDGRYARINDQLAALNGLPPEAHIGRTAEELLPDLNENDAQHVRRVLETSDATGPIEYHVASPDAPEEGRDWLLFHFPVADAAGVVLGTGTVVQDLTEIRRAEADLSKSRRKLAGIEAQHAATLDRLTTGVIVIRYDDDGKLGERYANPSAYDIVKGTPLLAAPDRFVDLTSATIFDLTGRPVPFERWPLGRALNGEVVAVEEYKVPRSDGTWLHILTNAAPVQNASGESAAAVAVFEDITARREAEDAVRALNDTLEERVRQRTEQVRRLALALTLAEQRERSRVAQILHDNVQQVLHGVRLRMEMLSDDLTDGEAMRVREAHAMLSDAIQLTRSLSVDLAPPILKGGGVAEGLGWLAKQMDELHSLTVRVQAEPLAAEPSPATVTLVVQLVRELLFNVVKHAGVDSASVIVAQDGGGLRIEVVDHGRGFVPALADEGYGLVSVRERVELLDGTFEVASQVGSGTRTTLRLPLNPSVPGAR